MYQNNTPIVTYEGDNTVMLLQASKMLMKMVKKAIAGTKFAFPFEYLSQIDETLSV